MLSNFLSLPLFRHAISKEFAARIRVVPAARHLRKIYLVDLPEHISKPTHILLIPFFEGKNTTEPNRFIYLLARLDSKI